MTTAAVAPEPVFVGRDKVSGTYFGHIGGKKPFSVPDTFPVPERAAQLRTQQGAREMCMVSPELPTRAATAELVKPDSSTWCGPSSPCQTSLKGGRRRIKDWPPAPLVSWLAVALS